MNYVSDEIYMTRHARTCTVTVLYESVPWLGVPVDTCTYLLNKISYIRLFY